MDQIRELAENTYNRRSHPEELDQSELAKKGLTELSTFIQQLRKRGKNVIFSIEFGIMKAYNLRFNQIFRVILNNFFENYDENAVLVILGIDDGFTNDRMKETMGELLLNQDFYELENIDDESDFQVRPLPGNEAEVVQGTANVYSCVAKEKREPNNPAPNANNKRVQPVKKLQVYSYLMKYFIPSSYFTECMKFVAYHKAQKSLTISDFSRNSKPVLPFWKGLFTLCLENSFSKLFYTNIAHFETNGLVILPEIRKVFSEYQLRENKFSELMSEIWYILFKVKERNATPIKLLDLDLETNRTFATDPAKTIVDLVNDLSFQYSDEIARVKQIRGNYDTIMEFVGEGRIPRASDFEPFTPNAIDWNEFCPDPPVSDNNGPHEEGGNNGALPFQLNLAYGGRRKKSRKTKKSKKRSKKTRKH